MNNGSGQWMTVREFAQAAGVSIQAVYKRVDNQLSTYLKEENGRKYIHSDALQFVGRSTSCQPIDNQLTTSCQPDASADQSAGELRAALDAARDQLREAEQAAAVAAAERDAERKRADDLRAQLDAVDGLLQSEQQHAAELLKALSSSQLLQAGQMQLAMQPPADQTDSQSAREPAEDAGKPVKRGFFARLFKRDS